MTLDELLTQLKALEAAAEAASDDPEYADEIAVVMFPGGQGWIERRNSDGHITQSWVFGGDQWDTLEVAIQTAMIEVRAG